MNKSFWMPLTDGDVSYDASSRVEPKRAHHWFMDASEPELFCNKKQAVEVVGSRPMSGTSNANISAWENNSSFLSVSGQFTDLLFGSETVRTFNLVDRITPASGAGNLNLEIKGFEDQFGSDSFVGLSMSHTLEDPPQYNGGNERTILMRPISNNAEENFISLGQTFDKGGASFMLIGQHYSNGSDNIVSINQPFDIQMGNQYEKGNDHIMSAGPFYNKEPENFIPMCSAYEKANEIFISVGNGKGVDNILSMGGPSSNKAGASVVSMGAIYENENSSILSVGQNYKGGSNATSFGGIHNEPETNPSGGIISEYDLLRSQPSAQTLNSLGLDNSVDQSSNLVRSVVSVKNKEPKLPKNVPPNNFPSNVKSLLSTGMFDGLPVKYVSWSREKNLKGVIKGASYLCGCNDCRFSKALNAYELERHACCKTKHPNNHIFFENGKTIYAVAQELKSTPQEMLFEVIQNVTGSALNQTNFCIWKASFQAATRELQRIYGKDEVIMPS